MIANTIDTSKAQPEGWLRVTVHNDEDYQRDSSLREGSRAWALDPPGRRVKDSQTPGKIIVKDNKIHFGTPHVNWIAMLGTPIGMKKMKNLEYTFEETIHLISQGSKNASYIQINNKYKSTI